MSKNPEAYYEKVVLSSFINDATLYAEHRHRLKSEHFSECSFLLELLDSFTQNEQPFDIELLEAKAPQKEVQKLYDVALTTPVSNVLFYINGLKECYNKALIVSHLQKMLKSESVSSEQMILSLESLLDQKETLIEKEFKTQDEWIDVYDALPPVPRYATKVSFLDFCLGSGFELGFLVLIGGEPEAGKTSLGLQILNNMSLEHKTALFPFEFTMRHYLNSQKIIGKNYRNKNMYIVPNGEDLNELTNNIKMLHAKGVRAFLIDSQMRVGVSDAKNVEDEESKKFTTLGKLANKLNVLILFIVQNSKTDPTSPMGTKKGAYEAFIYLHVGHVPVPKDDKENANKPFLPDRRIFWVIKNKQSGKHFKEQVGFDPTTRTFHMIHEKRKDIPVEVIYEAKEEKKIGGLFPL
jgi:DNA repair protein RadA/Sms